MAILFFLLLYGINSWTTISQEAILWFLPLHKDSTHHHKSDHYWSLQGETAINVLDLSPSNNALQWTNLIKCLKPSTPTCPKITITAIHEKKEVLEKMGLHLGVEAQRLLFPFQFNPVVSSLENLDPETLPIKKGEPLAISSVRDWYTLSDFLLFCRTQCFL